MDNIVIREAQIDDAEEMISYLNIVGGESDNHSVFTGEKNYA